MTDEFKRETWDREFSKRLEAMPREKKEQAFKDGIIRRTFEGLAELPAEEAERVFKHTSQACLKNALSLILHFGCDPDKDDIDAFIAANEKFENMLGEGKASITRQGNIIDYITASGQCVCPLIKYYKLFKPFPNLCLCSKNFAQGLYEVGHKGPVRVEVLETYAQGGNSCHWKIELL